MHNTDPAPSPPSAEVTGLDTLYEIETPEGIDLTTQVAGPVPRLLAYSVDLFYRTLILIALGIALNIAGAAGVGLWLLVSFLLEWFYPVVFEVMRGGQTPGKKAFSLAVVNDNLTPISWGPSIMRNLLRFADFLPFGYFTGIISMTCSRHFQRLGDHAAGTLVVYREQTAASATLPQVAPVPPPRGLRLEDQQAIISLAERSSELSRARQQELADLLQPITERSGEEGLNRLHAIGRWLLGARTPEDTPTPTGAQRQAGIQ
ncbi:RDD family protein [Microbulbifer hydrolyticus]|uniref:RDD family membrane protein YckC n=1 Tax=Microbulbifer hydrolyticus TaxID=48074 RepID=A0A6P1T864_9GAMM|nr:RDD family protein [Microbulbifer hydrolyticus]MBB5211544.1 putative RDD family membrane protein YckC [Microbulbifer hydrolyticus]QHQ37716.1 RDD family protein [Microbulbifer hydrolyticus]